VTSEQLLMVCGVSVLALPTAGFLALGGLILVGKTPSEKVISRTSNVVMITAFIASIVTLALARGAVAHGGVTVPVGSWFSIPNYVLKSVLVLDAPGAVMMVMSTALCSLISIFSARYLHREPGFARFFLLMLLFAVGMLAIAAGGSVDIVFGGWELVGLTSALLIAFFHDRVEPVRHGLRAFAVYRTCDIGFLSGAVLLHHITGTSVFSEALPRITQHHSLEVTLIAALFVVAAMGKAASLPFTGWLPRAMEGPTPSSAIFYGALSIHAGPFLLIRIQPLLQSVPSVRWTLVGIGLMTAAHATSVGRSQTDIKSKLAYASVTQVSLIMAEVGMGWTTLALVHMAGHAILRTWELLRAPSLLQDRYELMRGVGGQLKHSPNIITKYLPHSVQRALYRLSIERWYIDDIGRNVLLDPLARLLRSIDKADQRFTDVVAGTASPPLPTTPPVIPQAIKSQPQELTHESR
jgi:NADH-quinone oxidoreductase subunit L